MTCPACGTFEARSYRTILGARVNSREQRCRCGIGWNTVERIEAGSIRHWARGEIQDETPQKPVSPRGEMPVKRQPNLPTSLSSDLSISSSPLSSDPKSESSLLGKPRARVGRPDSGAYTAEFLAFWAAIPMHRGNKGKAFKAWAKHWGEINSPDVGVKLVVERYKMRAATDDWQRGFNQHVATWLNEKGWDTIPDPTEYDSKGNSNGVPQRVQDSRDTARRWAERKKAVG